MKITWRVVMVKVGDETEPAVMLYNGAHAIEGFGPATESGYWKDSWLRCLDYAWDATTRRENI